MLPLEKLEKLSRSQRLRKIAKLLGEAEYRLSRGGALSGPERDYFGMLLEQLARDDRFQGAAAEGILGAIPGAAGREDPHRTLRSLNAVRHILLTETGRFTADWDFIDHDGRLDPQRRRWFPGMRAYLEDIRSPFNVGAMFRTTESFGVERLFLSPLCADPHHPRASRTAMGCVDLVPWERHTLTPDTGSPQTPGGPFFALETGGIPLGDFQFPLRGILITGSEELGVSPEALALADASLGRLTIPTRGAKGSLNVSVAFGIALQAWAAALAGS
ncbi:MAG: TrmH family RNA methyltransferase [Spirochaetaceae bacterium]|jgi:TrmH family RNA methyltransferase|nr:TrmH family RNA methyltransferase [Spirochaetaceae bacterium]